MVETTVKPIGETMPLQNIIRLEVDLVDTTVTMEVEI
jgi:hypothetical protein